MSVSGVWYLAPGAGAWGPRRHGRVWCLVSGAWCWYLGAAASPPRTPALPRYLSWGVGGTGRLRAAALFSLLAAVVLCSLYSKNRKYQKARTCSFPSENVFSLLISVCCFGSFFRWFVVLSVCSPLFSARTFSKRERSTTVYVAIEYRLAYPSEKL